MSDSDTLNPFLMRGIKCDRQAYEVDSIEASLTELRRARVGPIGAPAPAVAFGGRQIAFVILPNRWIVELLESGASQS